MPAYCSYFQRDGKCYYGSRCKFLHDTQSEDDVWYEKVSKFLANVLRHKADEFHVSMRQDGYCRISDILELSYLKKLSVREHDLRKIVNDNAKKRFALTEENNVGYIRANQGHTLTNVKDEELLEEIKDWRIIENCFHGTYKHVLSQIKREGLKCMGRNHMHFACPDISTGVTVSGMREDCEIQLILDVEKCFDVGMKFYRSANGVVLTKGVPERNSIPFEYFKSEKPLKRHLPNMPTSPPGAPKPQTEKHPAWKEQVPPPPRIPAPSRPAPAPPQIESHDAFPALSSVAMPTKKGRSSRPHVFASSAVASSQRTADSDYPASSSWTPAPHTMNTVGPSRDGQTAAGDDNTDQASVRAQDQSYQINSSCQEHQVPCQEHHFEPPHQDYRDREHQERPHQQLEQHNLYHCEQQSFPQHLVPNTCAPAFPAYSHVYEASPAIQVEQHQEQPQMQFEEFREDQQNQEREYNPYWIPNHKAGGESPNDWNQQGVADTALRTDKSKRDASRWKSQQKTHISEKNGPGSGSVANTYYTSARGEGQNSSGQKKKGKGDGALDNRCGGDR
eukprot:GEMP01017671.1.p1 GENE.GEMP01017671.1~~GEMP01017671.1.p1  ORF type:complete len:562 (+),score=109.11 GEMP01017671.1:101-1786(+)